MRTKHGKIFDLHRIEKCKKNPLNLIRKTQKKILFPISDKLFLLIILLNITI